MAERAAAARPVASLADLQALPKTELHLHLRGAIPLSFLRSRLRRRPPAAVLDAAPPGHLRLFSKHPGIRDLLEADDPAADLDRLFQYQNFEQFLAAYLFTVHFVRTIDDFRALVGGVRAGFGEQRITYAEVTVSIPEYIEQGLQLTEILEVLAEDPPGGPTVRWIVDPVRGYGPAKAEAHLEEVAARRPQTLLGVTLGGAEHLFPNRHFSRAYEIAREAGLRTTVHAGEAAGPESVWQAVRTLRVERIGHGVRAIEDPSLVRHLAERGIPLEICPTSNVRTGVYRSLAEHPARGLFEAGVQMSINTDDPTFFSTSLAEELAGLRKLGFSWPEIDGLARGASRFAFASAPAL